MPDRDRRPKTGSDGRTVQLPFAAFIAFMLVLLAFVVILWSVKRRPDVGIRVGRVQDLQDLATSVAGATFSTLEGGNRFEVVRNGRYFDRLFADVAAAQKTVHFETFLWHEGEIGDRFAALLAAKARSGVEVRLQLDASGTRPVKEETWEMLRAAGAKISKYHAFSVADLGRINNRTHRKIAVIDGTIAHVGGHCIAPEWTGDAQDTKHYRDTTLRIQGPIVGRIQSAFTENWVEETGEVTIGTKYFPPLPPAGNSPGHVVFTAPTGTASSLEILHHLAIVSAQRRLVIQNPYFLPDPEAIEGLKDAVKRGVEVIIMLQSADVTDAAYVQHASHHHFGALLEAGVKIYEYERALLHQKLFIVDGLWAGVGSTNFDDRSFEVNDEITVSVFDPAVAMELERDFAADLQGARKRELGEWRERGLWHRTMDGLAYLVNEQL
jgi:cardiolipin synthase